MDVIVIKKHQSNYPMPINFYQGDELKLGELDTEFSGWIRVTTANDNQGWAPVQYIDFTEGESQGIANHNYTAKELNTTLNEVLSVKQELNSWYWVENALGVAGWVPATTTRAIRVKSSTN